MRNKKDLTPKDWDIIRYFLTNGNEPAIQTQISRGANVSKRHLGDLRDEQGKVKKRGRLSILAEKEILRWKFGVVPRSGDKKLYYLIENRENFERIANEFLKDRDTAIIFMLSQYTQRMISNEYMDGYKGLNLEEDNVETFFGGDYVETFFEEGMKLSPTFLQYSIHAGLPEVEVAANILHSALEACQDDSPIRIYLDGGPKKFDITRQIEDYAEILYVSLLIDSKKYPELRSKIIDFFKGPAFGPQYFNLPFPDLLTI
jgi:hypothetical protein